MAAITQKGYVIGASPSNAEDVNYNNDTSGLNADDVQGAIDEVSATVDAIKDGTDIDSFSDVETAISTLQSNFQDGVDDIYDAVVAKGTTPASKSLSDVVQGIADIETATVHTETYTASSRASNLDMGESHEYRYVDTNSVPNANSGTYTYGSGSAGGTVDMLADNTYRYVNASNVYAAGQANPPTQEKSVTPSTSAQTVTPDSGKFLSKVSVGAIPNLHTSNSMIVPRWGTSPGSTVPATAVATRNPRVDFKNSTTYGNAEMIEIAMPEGYYAWSYGNSSCCIPTETKTVTAGTSATTVTPSNYNSGGNYVKYLKSVTVNPTPSQSKTVTASRSAQTVTPDSGKLLSSVTVNKFPDATGTYTASSRGSALDMTAGNNYRYVNTNNVPNSNSGTYTYGSGSTGGTVDMGTTNTYRYVNASNVYNKGKADGGSGKVTPSVATIIDNVTWTSDSERASKVSFSATSGYIYAIAWGGDSGWAGTPSCSGGTILGWSNSTHSVSGRTSGCGLFIVQATAGTVTLTATGSWPYNGLAKVIRVTA